MKFYYGYDAYACVCLIGWLLASILALEYFEYYLIALILTSPIFAIPLLVLPYTKDPRLKNE